MNRKPWILVLVAVLMLGGLWIIRAADSRVSVLRAYQSHELNERNETEHFSLSATNANQNQAFSFNSKSVRVTNDGPDDVYITMDETTAATDNSDVLLKSGESEVYDPMVTKNLAYVTLSAGKTATVRVRVTR